MDAYTRLAFVALLPALAAAAVHVLQQKTAFGKLNYKTQQAVCGIIFGFLAILGTEFGIPLNGAVLNCRDAAVLTAGLVFGAPAGLLAGFIGGVERWIAVAWGVGAFTRVACSLSTIAAGIFSACLRKYMFEDKKPSIFLAFAVGTVTEVFHMTMVFLTNMATPNEAMAVVKLCSIPMILGNSAAVFLAVGVKAMLEGERIRLRRSSIRISQTIQRWLLVTIVLAFLTTSYFVLSLQNKIADTQTDSLLKLALDEVSADVQDASDQNLLNVAHKVAAAAAQVNHLDIIAGMYDVSEISVVNRDGIITASTIDDFIGYDMASGEQSAQFLCLLQDTAEFVQGYGPISYDDSVWRKYAGVRIDKGFVQVGYDAAQFQKNLGNHMQGITKNRHVGNTGFILILDEQRQPVSVPAGMELNEADVEKLLAAKPETTSEQFIQGEDCFCHYRETEGFSIISVLPAAEALQVRNVALYVNTFMEILVFAVLFALVYLLIKKVVVDRIKAVNASLARITGGDLDEVVDVRTNEELAFLSDDINSTVSTLKRYIAEASERIAADLALAKNIQASALPNVFPAFPKRKDFDIFASMDPAKEVGGDFYDFYMTGSDVLNFLVADVSGKGIPAAMFMMRAKTELKSLTEAGLSLDEVFTRGNSALCEGNDAGMFVTAWQGSLDLDTGLLQYVNAGHNPPLVRHADGSFAYLKSRAGFVLAGMEGVRYRTQQIQLDRGDTIYLYTDGVTEATDAHNALYGEERLLKAVNSQEFENMQELCEYVRTDMDVFVADAPQFDDITMVALKYIGKPPRPTIHFDNAAISDIPVLTEFVEEKLAEVGCPMKAQIQINIAIDEIYSNIVKFAYPGSSGPVTVQLVFKEDPRCVFVRFADNGVPYNPLTKEDPDITLGAEERSIGGLGIYMVKKSMDDMLYKYEKDQNILTIVKVLE